MIAKLSGRLDAWGDDWAVIDVGGVGYLVYCSARTLRHLPPPGEPVRLLVDTHVREDHIHLYGFADGEERTWFRLLQTVQGVGAKVALAILSAMAPAELTQAVAASDRAAIAQANGVGGRLAGRIVAELKEKVAAVPAGGGPGLASAPPPARGPEADAVSALVNLGYRRGEAFVAVAGAARRLGPEPGVEALIRAGLKELVL